MHGIFPQFTEMSSSENSFISGLFVRLLQPTFMNSFLKIAWIPALTALAATFMGSSSGAGISQNTDRTGSPLALGNCNSCHSGGSQTPTLTVELLRNDQVVTRYTPGAQHKLRVSLSSTEYIRYGFQTVALDSGNANIGSFSTGSTGTRVTTITGRSYGEHSQPSTTGVFELNWQAPADDVGEITFYTAGLGAKNPTSESGDRGTTGVLRVTAGFPLQTEIQQADNFLVGPIPAGTVLNFYNGTLRNTRIIDAHGRIIIVEGEGIRNSLPVEYLNPGFYWLTGIDQHGKQRAVRFIKS
jgi:hypothetical protein